jgi:hypothetical protein
MTPIDWRELDPQTAEKIRKDYLHIERSKLQVQKDLTLAFDRIHELKCKQRSLKTRIWVLSGAIAALATLTGWLADHLYDCIALAQHTLSWLR